MQTAPSGTRRHDSEFTNPLSRRTHLDFQGKDRAIILCLNDYVSSAIETAKGCAEWLHRWVREDWGFPDPAEMTMAQRFTSLCRRKRHSFGYPACPNLEDQAGIWKLLKPEEIGVQLMEGFIIDPEANVSAVVFPSSGLHVFFEFSRIPVIKSI